MSEMILPGTLKRMFLAGTKSLETSKEWINELNVFPVPDGDTGTNMTLTLLSAVRELEQLKEDASLDDVGSAMAKGTLRGARGNSGVIMSQLVRGFTKAVENAKELDASLICLGLEKASHTAYKAVMKPKEGTILTIAKAVSDKARELVSDDISLDAFFRGVLEHAAETLEKTPEMLPVLKEAGVVDSGGQGLLEFLKGAYDAFSGKDINLSFSDQSHSKETTGKHIDTSNIETSDIKFGYCTEFIIELNEELSDEQSGHLREYLSSLGDSLVYVSMDNIVKVHVHTDHPGLAIEKSLEFGQLSSLKIDNMRIEHNEKVIKEEDRRMAESKGSAKEPSVDDRPLNPFGFVTVCSGDGIKELFDSLGVDEVIEGGQTMNPSTEDILAAASLVRAENVIILPNNSNIIMAAEQAKQLLKNKNAYVIPTRNICQGISAMIAFMPDASVEENIDAMGQAASNVRCGEVTHAVRNTKVKNQKIKKGDYMGIGNGEILSVSNDLKLAVCSMINTLAADNADLITIYYGADSKESDAEEVRDEIAKSFSDADVEIVYGGQNVYNYIVSVE